MEHATDLITIFIYNYLLKLVITEIGFDYLRQT